MADSNTPFGSGDWQTLSEQYWNAWQKLSRASEPGEAAATPWHEGLEQWVRLFGKGSGVNETAERMLASARSYADFMQAMVKAASSPDTSAAGAWTDAMRRGFSAASGEAAYRDNPIAQALHGIGGKGATGLWDMMEGFAPLLESPLALFKSWVDVPAFGFLREHQEHWQKMAVAMADYQQQMMRYNALLLEASRRGFELFEAKLAERDEPGRRIDSVRALYDLWVDAAEDAYAEVALSPEFREVYGALVNAQMRVRSHVQNAVERMAGDFGMPTRSELDSIGKRLHEIRRELAAIREAGGLAPQQTHGESGAGPGKPDRPVRSRSSSPVARRARRAGNAKAAAKPLSNERDAARKRAVRAVATGRNGASDSTPRRDDGRTGK